MSIRLRVALVFTVALAIAFTLGSLLFLSQLHAQLVANTDATLQGQLAGIGGTISAGTGSKARGLGAGEKYLIQVISPADRVVMYSSEAGRSPMLSPGDIQAARSGSLAVTKLVGDEQVRLFAEKVPGTGAGWRSPGWPLMTSISRRARRRRRWCSAG